MGRWRSSQTHESVKLATSVYGGANPSLPTFFAEVAQLAEHPHGKGKVTSSNLVLGSMAKKKKPFIKLQCSACKRINYFTNKPKTMEGKLELKKFCKWCRKHTVHKEGRKT